MTIIDVILVPVLTLLAIIWYVFMPNILSSDISHIMMEFFSALTFLPLIVRCVYLIQKHKLLFLLNSIFRFPEIYQASYIIIAFTVFSALLLYAVPIENPEYSNLFVDFSPWWNGFLFHSIPTSLFQEIIFRWIILSILLSVMYNNRHILILSALLFAIIHIPFSYPLIGFSITFIAGLFRWHYYLKTKDLWLITISHAILNYVALSQGLVSLWI